MKVTYIKHGNIGKYVDHAGRIASVKEYGKDFTKCSHNFVDTGTRGNTLGPNGKPVSAKLMQCSKCDVYTVIEMMSQ